MAVWECALCSRSFTSQSARTAHINNSTRHPRCLPCNRGFVDEASKLQHLRTASAHNYCEHCERDFPSHHALQQHRQGAAVHRDEAYYYLTRYATDSSGSVVSPRGLNASLDDSEDEPEIASTYRSHNWLDFSSDSDIGVGTRDAGPSVTSEVDALPELFLRMSVRDHLRNSMHQTARDTSFPGLVLNESSSDGEDGSYLDASSVEMSSDSDEGGGDTDSDFLAHSSDSEPDSESGVSNTPFQSMDVHRSTITHSSRFGTSASGLNFTATSHPPDLVASSSTLASPKTSDEIADGKLSSDVLIPRTMGTGRGYTCPLCLEQSGDQELELSSVKCGHVFCTPCINRALGKKSQCPICRAPAKTRHLRRIYLSF